MPFQYDTLPSDDYFRLCTLEPGAGDAELICTLTIHLRKSAPAYEALSYTWGDVTRDECPLMRCNNDYMEITKNLNQVLRNVRLADKARTVWVDQICINQCVNALTERSQQVNIMAPIYSGATMVICCLGPEPKGQGKLVDSLIGKMQRPMILLNSLLDPDMPVFPSQQELDAYDLPKRDSPEWDAFETMITLPYFTRMWTVQEMVVANRFQLLWGQTVIPSNKFHVALANAQSLGVQLPDSKRTPGAPSADGLSLARISAYLLKPQQKSWIDLMPFVRPLQCGWEKDRVYAMMGIADGAGCHIHADYSKSDAEVFTDLASQIISASKCLEVLRYVYVEDPWNVQRPLWAPRWKHSTAGRGGGGLARAFHDYNFKATGDRMIVPGITSKIDILALQGLNFDTAEVVCDTILTANADGMINIIDSFRKLAENEDRVKNVYGQPLIIPFVTTLAAGRSIDKQGLPCAVSDDSILDEFVGYMYKFLFQHMFLPDIYHDVPVTCQKDKTHLIRLAQGARSSPSADKPLFTPARKQEAFEERLQNCHWGNNEAVSTSLETIRPTESGLDGARKFDLSCGSNKRRFFITHEGYIGAGPSCMQTNDTIAFLYGGTTPYVIRQTEEPDQYLFLGECYVHGLMDGEVLGLYENGTSNLSEKWFNLL